jgi:hypothetical protein
MNSAQTDQIIDLLRKIAASLEAVARRRSMEHDFLGRRACDAQRRRDEEPGRREEPPGSVEEAGRLGEEALDRLRAAGWRVEEIGADTMRRHRRAFAFKDALHDLCLVLDNRTISDPEIALAHAKGWKALREDEGATAAGS